MEAIRLVVRDRHENRATFFIAGHKRPRAGRVAAAAALLFNYEAGQYALAQGDVIFPPDEPLINDAIFDLITVGV